MTMYLIWSNEHHAWWKPGCRGYTTLTHLAGRYTELEARRIVRDANRTPNCTNDEVMVQAPPNWLPQAEFDGEAKCGKLVQQIFSIG